MHSPTSANVKSRTCYLRYKNKALKVPNLSIQLAFSFRSISVFVPLLSVARKGNGNFILSATVGLPKVGKSSHARMFSRPKILFLVSLRFVALLNSIPTYLFEFLIFLIILVV